MGVKSRPLKPLRAYTPRVRDFFFYHGGANRNSHLFRQVGHGPNSHSFTTWGGAPLLFCFTSVGQGPDYSLFRPFFCFSDPIFIFCIRMGHAPSSSSIHQVERGSTSVSLSFVGALGPHLFFNSPRGAVPHFYFVSPRGRAPLFIWFTTAG